MIRVIGVLLALVGLVLVGLHDDKRRPGRNQPHPPRTRLWVGLATIGVGAVIAIFGTQIALMMGVIRP